MNTYQHDSSFFYIMKDYGNFPWIDVISSWFQTNKVPKYRLIEDSEYEGFASNLTEIVETYPGVKVVTVIVNPWLRTYVMYETIKHLKNTEAEYHSTLVSNTDLSSFENFVKQLADGPVESDLWCTTTTNQVEWIDSEEGEIGYLLRVETLLEDFQAISDFFTTDTLDLSDENIKEHFGNFEPFKDLVDDYQQFYNDETKDLVAKVFAKDIERFGYQF